MTRVRSWLFDAYLPLWLAVFSLPIPVLWLFGSPPRNVRFFARLWARGVLVGLRVFVGLRFREHGRSLFPETPCLIICNHQSTWETLAALVLFPDVAIVAKRELLRIPVIGWYMRRSPLIIIDRDGGTAVLRQMIVQATAALAADRHVLIFPEGTRREVGEEIHFKRGVELLYKALGVPVAPVVVNSGQFWDRSSGLKRAGIIDVTYLPVIPPNLSMADFTRLGQERMQAKAAPACPDSPFPISTLPERTAPSRA